MRKNSYEKLAFFGCVVWALFVIFPLWWIITTSFKSPHGVISGSTYFPWIDFEPTLKNWYNILTGVRGNLVSTFTSSVLVSFSSSIIATLLGTMAAYALVRFTFTVRLLSGLTFIFVSLGLFVYSNQFMGVPVVTSFLVAFCVALALSVFINRFNLPGPIMGNDDIVFWFVSQRLFPPIIVAFALFLLYNEFGKAGFTLLDTYLGLTFAYISFSLPIVIWLMRDFIAALPVEVEEAAHIDNVPQWKIFTQIVLPMCRPGLIATFVITLAFTWNEFLFALFLTNSEWQTLPILVAGQNSQRGDEWWAIATAASVAIIPMIIVAGLLGRLMRSGLLVGAIK